MVSRGRGREGSSTSELKTRPEEEGFCPAPETRARGGGVGKGGPKGRSGAVGTHLLSQSRKAVKRPMVSQFVSLGHYPTSALVFLDILDPPPPLFSMSCI